MKISSAISSMTKKSFELTLEVNPVVFAVCRLESAQAIPDWATRGSFFSIVRTADELSLVCAQYEVPAGIQCEMDWVLLKVKGPLDFGLTGILASLAGPLATSDISVFAISSFDTDYLLVKQQNLEKAKQVLSAAGHTI